MRVVETLSLPLPTEPSKFSRSPSLLNVACLLEIKDLMWQDGTDESIRIVEFAFKEIEQFKTYVGMFHIFRL